MTDFEDFDLDRFLSKSGSRLIGLRELFQERDAIPKELRLEIYSRFLELAREEDPRIVGSQGNRIIFRELNEKIDALKKEWNFNLELVPNSPKELANSGLFSSKDIGSGRVEDMFLPASPDDTLGDEGLRRLRKRLKILMFGKSEDLTIRREEVARISLNFMLLTGLVLYDPEIMRPYYFSKKEASLMHIKSNEFRAKLSGCLQVNRANPVYKYIENQLIDHAISDGTRFTPHFYSYYSSVNNIIYCNFQPDVITKVSRKKTELTPNGTDNVYFVWDNSNTAVSPRIDKKVYGSIRKHIVNTFSSVKSDDGFHELLEAVIKAIMLGVLFMDDLKGLPVLIFWGPAGSGKTTSAWTIGGALFGDSFEVTGYRQDKEDGVVAYLSRAKYGVIDNVSADPGRHSRGWLNDLLARVSTRQRLPMRKYYSTNDMILPLLNAIVAVTTIKGEFSKEDVLDRSLVFHTSRPDVFLDENLIRKGVIKHRPEILGELILLSQKALKHLKNRKYLSSPVRMAGFYDFATNAGIIDPHLMDKALRVFSYREKDIDIDSRILMFLETITREEGQMGLGNQRIVSPYYTATELFDKQEEYKKKRRMMFGQKSPTSLGKWFSKNVESLAKAGIEVEEKTSNRGTLRRFFIKP